MKKKIAYKLFTVTTIFLIIFTTAIIIFQSEFFEKFYTSRKMSTVKSNFEKLKSQYKTESSNLSEVLTLLKNYEDENNAKIIILDSSGEFKLVTNYTDQQGNTNSINIIKRIVYRWTSDPKAFQDIKNKGNTVTYVFQNSGYNIKNIVCIAPVTLSDNNWQMIFSVSSLQPVNEAVSILKEYYIYVYIGIIVIILLLSLFYSNMISKPLIRINKTAEKMANLDFSEKCIVKSDDEMGNLADTLNFLSDNLDKSLKSLQESNEKLKEDIEKEKSLEKMRKEFVAGVSHELKTPISLIEGYAEGLKDDIVQGSERDYYIDVIIDEAKRMGSLVTEMLELSQLEHGNYKLNIESFNINEAVDVITKKFINVIKEKNIHIEKNYENNFYVNGDVTRIEQVITNLFTNAINHTPNDGTISLSIAMENENVKISVENQGDGISSEHINQIWERFYKIDKSRNRSFGGTGLGLSIVRNIMELHKCEYGVRNTDLGVEFYFYLPQTH